MGKGYAGKITSNPLVEIMIVGLLAMVFSGLAQMVGVSGALTAGVVTMFGLFGVAERRRPSLLLQIPSLDNQKDISSKLQGCFYGI